MDDALKPDQLRQRIRYNEMVGIAPLLMLFDAGLVFFMGKACAWGLGTFTHRTGLLADARYELFAAMVSICFPLVMHLLGAYRDQSIIALRKAWARNLIAWGAVFSGALIVTVVFKISAQYSRAWLGLWASSTMLMLLLAQFAWWSVYRSRQRMGIGCRRVAIVGNGTQAERLINDLRQDGHRSFRVVAYFGALQGSGSIPRLGDVADAPDKLTGNLAGSVDEVWILESAEDPSLVERLFHSAELEIFNIRVVPDVRGFVVKEHQIEHLGSHLLIAISTDPQRSIEGAAKTAIDYIGAALGLIVLAPVMLTVAIAIRLDDPGPVLFRQSRHGLKGQPFTIFKFRTLRAGSTHEAGQRLQQVSRSDERVTRLGRILRHWSIDELPQLFNVLRGEMSLVGPRPHEMSMNVDAAGKDFRYRLRHRVKPGMTGWAQVHGYRGPATRPEQLELRLRHDLWYIDNWSLWLDIRILLMTVALGFRHDNAF